MVNTAKLPLINIFVKRLDLVMTGKFMSSDIQVRSKELGEICDVSPQAARKWLTGKCLPDYDKMLIISKKFSVTVSYLIGEISANNNTEVDKDSILRSGALKGAITVDIPNSMFFNEMRAGDTAVCYPCSKLETNDAIYMLQSSNDRFFRKMSYNDSKELIISFEENGEPVVNIYNDKNMIDIFLSSIIGRVDAVIRKV